MSLRNGHHKPYEAPSQQPYVVKVGKTFLFTSVLFCILLSYGAGIASRYIALQLYFNENPNNAAASVGVGDSSISSSASGSTSSLPNPRLIDGKVAPHTLYTAKNFDTAASATTSSVHLQQDQTGSVHNNVPSSGNGGGGGGGGGENACRGGGSDKVCTNQESNTIQIIDNSTFETNKHNGGKKDEEEEHLPSGQHLLVDIKNVDSTFLNSESRLAHAMVKVVNESKLTLLSYHCHSLVPIGVSCVGVLLESHVSFHTWPEEGVITLDLFTCGSGELVPVLPLIENAFAIPQQNVYAHHDAYRANETEYSMEQQPVVVWTHKMRGFRTDKDRNANIWANDLGVYLVEKTNLDMKVEVASTETNFQRIHIFDIISAKTSDLLSYHKSLSDDGSYQSQHPELYQPDRIVFLEGVLQSTRHGDEAYHEALVHPAMFAHPNPKKVAIVGGGEGATLRETLKHKHVTKVTMIEIDEIMVKFSHQNLPAMSDCSDFVGSADWCGDDDRAEIFYEDATAWINNRFSEEKKDSPEFQEEPFDVLIMDALDPQDDIPFADLLYTNVPYLKALYNALTDDGIIVMQLGGAPDLISPSEMVGYNEKRGILTQILAQAGFISIHIYEEAHCGFMAPWSFLVATKSEISRKRWYRSNGEIDIDIHKRIIRTHSGQPALKYFDGATMMSYQMPSKAFEAAYCRNDPMPDSCKSVKVEKKVVAQSVRRRRQNPFDVYLDRHAYEHGDEANLNSFFCDYLYYNEESLKGSSSFRFPQELMAYCNH